MAANTPQQHVQAVKKAEDEAKQTTNTGRVEEARQQQQKTVEYTFIISGLNYGPNANLLNEASSDSIMLVFDAVPSHSYSRTVEKTSFVVESGDNERPCRY